MDGGQLITFSNDDFEDVDDGVEQLDPFSGDGVRGQPTTKTMGVDGNTSSVGGLFESAADDEVNSSRLPVTTFSSSAASKPGARDAAETSARLHADYFDDQRHHGNRNNNNHRQEGGIGVPDSAFQRPMRSQSSTGWCRSSSVCIVVVAPIYGVYMYIYIYIL